MTKELKFVLYPIHFKLTTVPSRPDLSGNRSLTDYLFVNLGGTFVRLRGVRMLSEEVMERIEQASGRIGLFHEKMFFNNIRGECVDLKMESPIEQLN